LLLIICAGLDDLHVYDVSSQTWEELALSGTPPSARSNHGLAPVNGKLYLHGGYGGTGEDSQK